MSSSRALLPPLTPPPPAPPVHVVLVAQVDDLRWVLRSAFERHGGFEVVGEACTAAGAVATAARVGADLVVVDLDLPARAALDVVAQLRSACPGIAVVVLSGKREQEDVVAALQLGVTGVLGKATRLSVLAERARAFAEETRPHRTG